MAVVCQWKQVHRHWEHDRWPAPPHGQAGLDLQVTSQESWGVFSACRQDKLEASWRMCTNGSQIHRHHECGRWLAPPHGQAGPDLPGTEQEGWGVGGGWSGRPERWHLWCNVTSFKSTGSGYVPYTVSPSPAGLNEGHWEDPYAPYLQHTHRKPFLWVPAQRLMLLCQ